MNNKIPTYIVNLEKRNDRKRFIENQFKNRDEFKVEIISATEHKVPAIGLYHSLYRVIV